MEAVSRQHGSDLSDQRRLAIMEWQRCRHWIVAALEHCDTHDIDDIEHALSQDLMQFWPGQKSAMVTQIVTYPKLRTLDIFLCGGDLDELFEIEQVATEYARAWGCQRIVGGGRKGWSKVLAKRGWKPITLLKKDLTNE